MHTARCRHITRRLNQFGIYEEKIESDYLVGVPDPGDKLYRMKDGKRLQVTSNRANTFVKQLNQNDQVEHIRTYNNLTGSLQETVQQEYDTQGRLIHIITKGEYYSEETVILYAADFSISHCLRHYNDLFKDDEYIVMISDSVFCIENTYSYASGNLINTQVTSIDDDYILDIDYDSDGTIYEWSKQRIE